MRAAPRPAPSTEAPVSDARNVSIAAFLLRFAVVLWAAHRIPPVADGQFYDVIARRIANGLGYTWAWPDGSVTYAAHYPVGYPAFVGGLYWLFGEAPWVAMVGNAALGSVGVFAIHRIASRGGDQRIAAIAALSVAVHPGLVLYTPALMTEGVTAALVSVAMWVGIRAYERGSLGRLAMVGAIVAIATYVRPQSIALAVLIPLAFLLANRTRESLRAALRAAAVVTLTSALCLAPWTLRNAIRMHTFALVSVNDGWNLLIGTDEEARGTWAPPKVPPACREVFDEAEKNECFGRAALGRIEEAPFAWLALGPSKAGATFNYAGAGPWYLRAANPELVSERMKTILGGLEVAFERVTWIAALLAVAGRAARLPPLARRLGFAVALLGVGFALFPTTGYLAVLALVVLLGLTMRRARLPPMPPAMSLAFVHIASTMAIHVMFFGAGRYSLVVFPIASAVAAFAFSARKAHAPASFDRS